MKLRANRAQAIPETMVPLSPLHSARKEAGRMHSQSVDLDRLSMGPVLHETFTNRLVKQLKGHSGSFMNRIKRHSESWKKLGIHNKECSTSKEDDVVISQCEAGRVTWGSFMANSAPPHMHGYASSAVLHDDSVDVSISSQYSILSERYLHRKGGRKSDKGITPDNCAGSVGHGEKSTTHHDVAGHDTFENNMHRIANALHSSTSVVESELSDADMISYNCQNNTEEWTTARDSNTQGSYVAGGIHSTLRQQNTEIESTEVEQGPKSNLPWRLAKEPSDSPSSLGGCSHLHTSTRYFLMKKELEMLFARVCPETIVYLKGEVWLCVCYFSNFFDTSCWIFDCYFQKFKY